MTAEHEATEVQAQKHYYPNGKETVTVKKEAGEIIAERKTPYAGRDEDGNQTTKYESKSILFDDIETRKVNQYAEFTREFESFDSTAASKSDSEVLKVVLIDGGDMEIIDAADTPEEDWGFRYDEHGQPNGYSHEKHDMEMTKQSRRVDQNRSTGSARLKINRSVVDRHDTVFVIKYRDASGASRGSSSWSKFEPIRAVRLEAE